MGIPLNRLLTIFRRHPLTRQIKALSCGEKAQTQSKRAPNRAKLCKSGPYSPRGLHNKDWAETAPLGYGRTTSAPAPLQVHLEPIFGWLSPTDIAKAVT
jgi:hypothetical protein